MTLHNDFSHKDSLTVAIISDTHAYLHPEINDIIKGCDIAVHAGDICDGKVLEAMQPKLGEVIAVAGNNDIPALWPEEQYDVVSQLPAQAEIHLPGGLLRIEHGHLHDMHKPDHADIRQAHPKARAVVYGHTHKKVIDDFELPWVVNPGAAGQTRNRGGSSCLVLTAGNKHWSFESFRFLD